MANTHEKMFNITNPRGNTNLNHKNLSPHNGQNGCHQKKAQITNVGKDVQKKESS